MNKSRLEAFSDGVLAIIITIMVLDLHAPHEGGLESLKPLIIPFCSYTLSFTYVAIYWNNHHHMCHTIRQVNGSILWANLHLLFWLSLFPFVTDWVGESRVSPFAVGSYGVVLLMAAIAYWLLQQTIIREHGDRSLLARAVGRDFKGKISPAIYLLGIVLAAWARWVSMGLYFAAALIWLIPDPRIENQVMEENA